MQTLRRYGALPKAVFMTPHQNIFYQLHDEAQRWQHATGERVEVAFDIEGPPVLQLTEWPSAVRRNQVADSRFAFWGEPQVTVKSCGKSFFSSRSSSSATPSTPRGRPRRDCALLSGPSITRATSVY